MTSKAMSPNQREGISAQSSVTGLNEYITSTNGALDVNATITPVAEQDVDLIKVGGSAIALGQGLMAASLPVTIASNQSAISIKGDVGTLSQLNLASSDPITAAIVDASGNQITSFGGGVQYDDGEAAPSPIVGTALIWDNGGTLSVVNNTAKLPVSTGITNYALETGGNIELISQAISTNDSGPGNEVMMAGFRFDDVAPDPVDEGDAGYARMSANHNLYTTIRDAAGNERGLNVDANGGILANPTTPSTIVAFATDIPTAGSRVQLASNAVTGVVIQAKSTNTGVIYVGGSNVSSTVFGAELQPGQSVGLAISNTDKIYVDTATNGNDVSVLGS